MTNSSRETYLIRLRAEQADVPAATRLRLALKRLLRDYRLRCVEISQERGKGERR